MISRQYEEAMKAAQVLLEHTPEDVNPNVYTILQAHHQAIKEIAAHAQIKTEDQLEAEAKAHQNRPYYNK